LDDGDDDDDDGHQSERSLWSRMKNLYELVYSVRFHSNGYRDVVGVISNDFTLFKKKNKNYFLLFSKN
jgi:hypothetical protein